MARFGTWITKHTPLRRWLDWRCSVPFQADGRPICFFPDPKATAFKHEFNSYHFTIMHNNVNTGPEKLPAASASKVTTSIIIIIKNVIFAPSSPKRSLAPKKKCS